MEGEKQLKIRFKLLIIASFMAVFMAGSAGFNFALAWTEPTEAPPGGNVAKPINEGPDEQTKTGNLILANYLCFANNDSANCRNAWEDFVGFWKDGAPNGIYYDEGNVGIGAGAPSYARLLVQTDGAVEGLHITRTAAAANAYLNIENESATPIFKVNQDGKVGVGIANPEKTLHVYKDSGDNAEIDIQSVAGSGKHWGIYQERVDNPATGSYNEAGDLRFWGGGYNRVFFSDDGRVGIGTSFSTYQDGKVYIYEGGSSLGAGLKVLYSGSSPGSVSDAGIFYNVGSDATELKRAITAHGINIGINAMSGSSNGIAVQALCANYDNCYGVYGASGGNNGIGVLGTCDNSEKVGCVGIKANNLSVNGLALSAIGARSYFSGRVGIGDETPDEKLEVRDDTTGAARIRITDIAQNPEFQLQYGPLADEHWGLYSDQLNADSFNIWSYNGGSSGNRLTISQSGNVGINESSPADKLHIAGQIRIDNDNNTTNKGCIRYNGTANQLEYSNDCASYSAFGSGGTGSAGNLLEVLQAGSDAGSFAGVVKIGDPAVSISENTTPLDVGGALTTKWIHSTSPGINTFEGDIQFNMTSGVKTIKVAQSTASHGGDLQILAGDAANNIFNSGDGGEILIKGGASTGAANARSGKVRIEGGDPLLSGNGGHVEIYGGPGGSLLGTADGGNVYIIGGGADEGENGNVYINGGSGGSRGGDIFLNASGTLMGTGIVNVGGISHNTTLKVWGNESITGRLGINTNSPAYRLDVNGQMRLQPSTQPAPVRGVIYFDGTANKFKCSEDGTSFVDCVGSGGTSANLPTGASGQTLRHDGSSWVANELLYNNGTNIGIGTASPATKLTVYDAVSGPIITISGLSSNYRGVKIEDTVGSEKWFTGTNDIGKYVIRRNGTINDLVISDDGKVGVGTAVPNEKLEVRDDTIGTARIRITDTVQNPELQFQYGTLSNDHWSIYNNQSDDSLRVWGGGTDRLTILQDGKVGIRTDSPDAWLEVRDDRDPTGPIPNGGLAIFGSDDTQATKLFSFAVGDGAKALNLSSIALGFWTISEGDSSVALGSVTKAQGRASVAMGFYSTSTGEGAVSIGRANLAEGDASLAVGYHTKAKGNNSFSQGISNIVEGEGSAVFGTNSSVAGATSFSAGDNNIINSSVTGSMAFGRYATVSHDYSAVFGLDSSAASRCYSSSPNTMKVCGVVQADAIQTSGGDFAEEFSASQPLSAGTVVVMGDDGYKSVKPCSRDYDQSVVGVVSDVAGLIMGKIDSETKITVAMVGVVKVKVSNINGAIKRGDLLVTSRLAGIAMKNTENLPGTIIGKAMEDFDSNNGEIMALINLQ